MSPSPREFILFPTCPLSPDNQKIKGKKTERTQNSDGTGKNRE